jgi:formylglycine-generating enzyme required for sulfatase activity
MATLAVLAIGGAVGGLVPASAAPPMFRDCPTCPQLVRLAPGRFQMGSTLEEGVEAGIRPDRAAAERPRHQVAIGYAFAIGRYEVTVAEFNEFAKATGFDGANCLVLVGKTWRPDPAASWKRPGYAVTDKHSATCLSYNDFQRYLDWLSQRTGQTYRFASEAEWEYAASTGAVSAKPADGVEPASRQCLFANAADRSFKKAFPLTDWKSADCEDRHAAGSPVGSYAANRDGVFDMAGNLAEFVSDCFAPNHEGAPADGSARRAAPAVCALRVIKGGSWAAEPGMIRPSVRMPIPLEIRGNGHGLRVVREVSPGSTR